MVARALFLLTLIVSLAPAANAADRRWSDFKTLFVQDDGRVVDTGNKGVSHSEGQGYGMLLAVDNDDRKTFDKMWGWTEQALKRSQDALHSWRYDPATTPHVKDRNNASDGDILIAWALLRASKVWRSPAYAASSASIRRAVLNKLTREIGGRLILLPGIVGFNSTGDTTINLSYFIFPAFNDFIQLREDSRWVRLRTDGKRLVMQARFGAHKLPPDWILIKSDGSLEPAHLYPPHFGFDAIRIPLYLAWDRTNAAALASFNNFWASTANRPAGPPAWIDIKTGEEASYPLADGGKAIAALAMSRPQPERRLSSDYYSSVLLMLAKLAHS